MLREKIILAILLVLALASGLMAEEAAPDKTPKLLIFYSVSCHACSRVKNEFIPRVKEKFADRIEIEYRDTADMENYKMMLALMSRYAGDKEIEFPVLYFSGNILTGEKEVKGRLVGLIEAALDNTISQPEPASPKDLVAHFLSFTPLAVAGAGLIDGFNPCAFTVIVFFISFLAFQGYRRRELVAIGLSFIFAVFLTYLLLGLGLFGFLYRIKGFWLVIKIFNLSVGIFSIILGVLCLYDLFKFKRDRNTEGLILQLPKAIKNRIHKVIGSRFRMHQEVVNLGTVSISAEKERNRNGPLFCRLVLGALACGFLVSLLEAVCTGQMYLPAIAFILKTTSLKLPAISYLFLYNLMFIVPLLAVFIFALLGVSSQEFAGFLKRHLGAVKILMALLFFSLGIFLLWKA